MGELESLRTFLAVADARSFTGAARLLGTTPASVTRTIAALEDRLGIQLLLRTTRQVSLTSAGAGYLERMAPLVRQIEAATEETRAQYGVMSGRLRLAAPMSLGQRVLPGVLSQFAARHGGTHVSVVLSDHFIDIVEEDFDLAIRISGPPVDKSTVWRKLCDVPRLLVASPGYLAARGAPSEPEDLTEHDCLGYAEDAREPIWDLSSGTRRRSHRAKGIFSSNNGDLLADLALSGEGIALLPRFIVAHALTEGRLKPVLPDWMPPPVWLTLYYPPYERLPVRVATFSDFFEVYVKETRPL